MHFHLNHPRASDLHVISVISNPVRFNSRVKLFKDFMENTRPSGVTHWIVEAVFGHRAPSVCSTDNPNHIIVRCDDEIWLKENLINIGARHLPADAKYVMWLDGDVRFERDYWALETIETLQNYPVVQPFSHVVDYGPGTEIIQTHTSFAYCYNKGPKLHDKNELGGWVYGGPYWHPGYGFAFRMDIWNAVGGMMERAVCGAADYHMATALIGRSDFSRPGNIHPNYKHMVQVWEDRAEAAVHRSIGHIAGTIHHFFHGRKEDRKYIERWDVLTKTQFDPYADLTNDRNGVLRLAVGNDDRGRRLRDGLKAYFRDRNEDANT